jgi:aspartate/methionine/tyrosine aminotransferase
LTETSTTASAGRATSFDFTASLRPEAVKAPESGIVEVFNYGRNRQGLIPLWVGESDLSTPSFICDAATRSFEAGETFYTYQRGIPELREAIAAYMTSTYASPYAQGTTPFSPERFFVTIGGMHALQLAIRMIAGPGDEVILPSPAWPNFAGALTVSGADVVEVPLHFTDAAEPQWLLDIAALERAVTPRSRALIINSPANPTGWTATRADLQAILDLSRRHGLWIVADEIYGRFVYDGGRSPSFHDIMDATDKVMFVQTLSKNWTMTGWRCGWLEAPEELGPIIENLVQYSSSGVAVPVQRAAEVALRHGDAYLLQQVERARQSRDILCDALTRTGRVRFARPAGAFYLFCKVEGEADTRALSLKLVDEAGLGIAPGSAFGKGAEAFMRLCFARRPSEIEEVARRLVGWLQGSLRR